VETPRVECVDCGHGLPVDARWCPLCFAPAPSPIFTGPVVTRRADDPEPVERVDYGYSRWQGSAVSFGPLGRIVVTLVLLAVGPLMAIYSPVGGWLAFLMWVFVILPWALRDVWRKVRVRR
jgi:hypothetical protein